MPVTLRSASVLQESLSWQFVEQSPVCFDRAHHGLCDVSRPVGDEVFSYSVCSCRYMQMGGGNGASEKGSLFFSCYGFLYSIKHVNKSFRIKRITHRASQPPKVPQPTVEITFTNVRQRISVPRSPSSFYSLNTEFFLCIRNWGTAREKRGWGGCENGVKS